MATPNDDNRKYTIEQLRGAWFAGKNSAEEERLEDDTAIESQVDRLQRRREQLEKIADLRRSIKEIEDETANELHLYWQELAPGYGLSQAGLKNLRKWVDRFGVMAVFDAMAISANQYLRYNATSEQPDRPLSESVEKAFDYVPRICTVKQRIEANPVLKDLFYIRGILRNRVSYCNDERALAYLQAAHEVGWSIEDLTDLVKKVRNWTEFSRTIEAMIAERSDQS